MHIAEIAPSNTPTFESYSELDEAYAFFNERLWEGRLPGCLITLHRHKRAYGYFAPQRYERREGKAVIDEIALNPDHFKARKDHETLSTLVHEMAHLWQQHFGKPSRGGYHNKEWGGEMKRVGLHPSSTGEHGGKETGQKVSHYVIKGGAFTKACAELLETGLAITWRAIPNGLDPKSKSGKRSKYVCPACDAAVWGKIGLNVACGDCELRMAPESAESEED
jgi:hypothetical protein